MDKPVLFDDVPNVLVACEFSKRVSLAFAALGFNAWSCDIEPAEQPGNHYMGDVCNILDLGWDLMIGHPPCTFLANSGVRWLYGGKGNVRDPKRWRKMEEGAAFFRLLWDAPIPLIALENPIMHSHAKKLIGVEPSQAIQPYEYGHGETKKTLLWLKGLPMLKPTNIVSGREPRVHHEPPGPERWKNRSRTFKGVADAMAAQYGKVVLDNVPVW